MKYIMKNFLIVALFFISCTQTVQDKPTVPNTDTSTVAIPKVALRQIQSRVASIGDSLITFQKDLHTLDSIISWKMQNNQTQDLQTLKKNINLAITEVRELQEKLDISNKKIVEQEQVIKEMMWIGFSTEDFTTDKVGDTLKVSFKYRP